MEVRPLNQQLAANVRTRIQIPPTILRLKALDWLIVFAGAQALIYAVIAWLSRHFGYGSAFQDRPIPLVLLLFGLCFGLHLAALAVGLRCHSDNRLLRAIFIPAIIFRVTLLFSVPIQEIDIYRYLWDGAVANSGVSPFRFSPQEILTANNRGSLPEDLAKLVAARDNSSPLATILNRVHYPELPTVYPPVSQAVLALGHWITPLSASVYARVILLKTMLVAFDIATFTLVWRLLVSARQHPAWTILYAWCPLVLKEFANSGHLDSIAICLTTAAVLCTVRFLFHQQGGRSWWRWELAGGILLGLAVGAKLYAIVLLPLIIVITAARCGWRHATGVGCVVTVTASLALAPMLLVASNQPALPNKNSGATSTDIPSQDSGDIAHTSADRNSYPLAGLRAFFRGWEMNDFLFLLVFENLRPRELEPQQSSAWFAVIPNQWRQAVVDRMAAQFSIGTEQTAFLITRAVTAGVFLIIATWLIWRAARQPVIYVFLKAVFLTLAWFWLLLPTQNPWYWTWALPLLPFARGRAWLAVSGLVLIYYLRFWFSYHWSDHAVLGTPYQGVRFFDYVIIWLEFAPWFVWLCSSAIYRSACAKERHAAADTVLV